MKQNSFQCYFRQDCLAAHNNHRAKHGVPALKLNSELNGAAQVLIYQKKVMMMHGVFDLNGTTFKMLFLMKRYTAMNYEYLILILRSM